jgi:hypothetical protein
MTYLFTKGVTVEEALAVVKAAGFKVTKPRAKKAAAPALNAVGKPYGASYDPNYRMKYRTPPLKRAQSVGAGISPEQWTLMCKLAQAEWDKTHKAADDGIPEFLRRDANNNLAA